MTINPANDLAAGKSYYVNVAPGAITDLSGNSFAGVAGTSSFNFTVAGTSVTDDYPWSSSTTGIVTVNGTATSGAIELVNDGDLFKVNLVAGTTYVFDLVTVAGGLSDPYLRLYSPSVDLIKFDDDSGTGVNAQITYKATASGTYYLGAEDYSSGIGAYKISAATVNTAVDDYAANTSTTGVVPVGGQISGNIEYASDEDWFKVALVAGTTYTFELTGNDGGGGTLGSGTSHQPYLTLYDTSGSYMKATASGGTGGDPLLPFTPTVSGNYYLSAEDLYGSGIGTYTIKAISHGSSVDDYPSNTSTTGIVPIGGLLSGKLDYIGDEDWIKVTLQAGTSYTFELTGTSGTFATSSATQDLVLRNSSGSSVANKWSFGTAVNIAYTPTVSGTFYLSVSDDRDTATGAYTVKASTANHPPTGTVTITGSAVQGQTLIAANTLVDEDGLGAITYQWKANGIAISGGVGSTFTLTEAQVGKTVTVVASYTDGNGVLENVASAASSTIANINDALTGSMTIIGTPTQGQTLTASNTLADLDGMGVVSYQWKAGGVAITGATSSTLTLTQAQVGKTISVTASYTDGHGTIESAASSASATVANVNDLPTGEVSITGTPTQGQTLTASNTLADLDGMGVVSYQWKAGGVAITGATSSTLTLAQAQVGKTISVTASYTDEYGAIESVASSASATVANVNDLPTGDVTITGTPTQGQTLTASNTLADLDGMGAVAYQWKAGGVAITGVTSGTFTLTSDEVGKIITVEARYTDGFGTAEGKTSSATATVASSDTTPPTATAFSPVDEASEVAVGSNIVVTFSEPIARGTGNIVLKTTAGVTVATYDAATSANIDISGNTLTINPSSDLAKDTGYTVEFAAGSVKDTVGNPYVGTTSYNFTTVAGTASVITLSPATTSITEGDTGSQSLNFTVTLSVASTSTVTVNYATANGTATAGSDYTATSGTLSFAAGETSKTITVSVLGDKTVESNENFTLVLSSPSGATLGSTASATVTIIDNDSTTVLPSFTVPGTLGNDFFIPSGGNNYLGGGGSDTYIISPYTLSGAVTAKITDTEGANVIQLVDGLTIASSSFYGNAAQLTLSNGASVQILGAAAFTYLVGANTPAGDTASSQTYAQFAATLGASVPTSSTPVSGTTNFVVPAASGAAIQMLAEASVTLVGISDMDAGLVQ